MANPQPNPSTSSNLLSTHRSLLDTLTSFLTVATHHILYLRRLYPPVSFLSARAYNYPVRQNRHPQVCTWINDAISAIRDQFEKNTVEKVSLCIYECVENRVLERWTFDLRSFPVVPKRDRDVPFESTTPTTTTTTTTDHNDDEDILAKRISVADLEANFRATLSRISTSASKLRPLPDGPSAPECSFTLTIEVKDSADRPTGRSEREERKWIAAEPDSFSTETSGQAQQPQTHAIRRLEAGELRMEVWVEESAAKFSFPTSSQSQATPEERRARMSYGAGSEKFEALENAYDLEPADVNRKPGGGAMTDYQRARG